MPAERVDEERRDDADGAAALEERRGQTAEARGVEGDVAGLAPVVHLRVLNLSGTYVYGDVAGLGALTDLRTLYLNRTCIEGNVGGLAPCLKLEYLYLGDTKVTGDVNGLSPKATPLHKLEGLWLVGAQVDGDRVSLLSNLKEIRESRAEEDAGEESVPETLVPVQTELAHETASPNHH